MNCKALCLLALAAFLGHVGSEVIMEVFPEEVIPGVTPTFTLRCSAADIEPAIISLQIKRTTQSTSRHIYETLATLNSSAINSSVVHAQLPGLTAHGMLSRVGVEVLPFLEITWQNPTMNDLGTYVCDSMMVGEMGRAVPMSAFISVTTQSPVFDRMLHLLSGLDTSVERLIALFGNVERELSTRQGGGSSGGSGGSSGGSGNGGGSSRPDANILHAHVHEGVSYVLWESVGTVTADDAMHSCADAGMYLTEINSEQEFRGVTAGVGDFIDTGSSILVGGQRMDRWVWPHTGGPVNFLRGAGRRGQPEACLAMTKVTRTRMVMDSVRCEDPFKFYLCSVDEPIHM